MVRRIEELGWGRIFVIERPNTYEGEPWGFDNGAFMAWRRGERFDEDKYLWRLERNLRVCRAPPLLAVLPDIVAGGRESFEYSLTWVGRLPVEWPWYLALQDGMDFADVEREMWQFDGLFLGGTNEFKGRTAEKWIALARKHGKPFHFGRCGTLKKLDAAVRWGVDSLDSALPLWSMEKFDGFVERYRFGNPQLSLF